MRCYKNTSSRYIQHVYANGVTLHQRHACSGVCLQSSAGTAPAEDGRRAAERSSWIPAEVPDRKFGEVKFN